MLTIRICLYNSEKSEINFRELTRRDKRHCTLLKMNLPLNITQLKT